MLALTYLWISHFIKSTKINAHEYKFSSLIYKYIQVLGETRGPTPRSLPTSRRGVGETSPPPTSPSPPSSRPGSTTFTSPPPATWSLTSACRPFTKCSSMETSVTSTSNPRHLFSRWLEDCRPCLDECQNFLSGCMMVSSWESREGLTS